MSLVNTPPSVSIPKDKGVTSNKTTSLMSPCKTPACIAAPSATTSSGFTPLCGSLPKNSVTASITFGILVMPPTKTISSISDFDNPASFSADAHGFRERLIKSATRLSNLARVNFNTKCNGCPPLGSIEINGWFISV